MPEARPHDPAARAGFPTAAGILFGYRAAPDHRAAMVLGGWRLLKAGERRAGCSAAAAAGH